MKKDSKKYIIYIVSFILLFALAYFFPYSNDDWAWGGKVGLERLAIFFKDYNGRYCGNLLVLLLTRSNIIKTIIMSSSFFLIAYLINKIINKKNSVIFILVLLLLFSMDKVLLRQTIVNTSGFTNYTFAMTLVLIYINHIKDILKKNNNTKIYLAILFLLLGFVSCLFMETITLYVLVISLFVVVFSFIKYKKIDLSNISYFIGSLIGSIVMFTNGAYHHVLTNDDFYRKVPRTLYDIVKTAARNYFNQIQNNTVSNHFVINLLICVLVIILLYKFFNNSKNVSKCTKKFISMLGSIVVLFNVLIVFGNLYKIPLIVGTPRYLVGFSTFIYCFTLGVLVLFTIKKDKKKNDDNIVKYRLLFYLISIVILAAPLLVLSPVTPRCSLPMFIFLILFTCELFNYLVDEKECNMLINIISIISLFLFIVLFYIYFNIYKSNITRNKEVSKQIEYHNKIIYVEKNGYEDYVWKNYPIDEIWAERFLNFYGFDDTYKIVVVKKGSVEINNAYDYKYNNLMIVAHPDDELLWGGSELINKDYVVVCVTCGSSKERHKEFVNVMNATEDEYIELGFVDTIDGKKATWDDEYSQIEGDLKYIINLKNWNKIVTHNIDGEYGHIHHKMVNKMVTKIATDDNLYYFGKYYSSKEISDKKIVKTISEYDTNTKRELFDRYYVSQKKLKFLHMMGYEKIVKVNRSNYQ